MTRAELVTKAQEHRAEWYNLDGVRRDLERRYARLVRLGFPEDHAALSFITQAMGGIDAALWAVEEEIGGIAMQIDHHDTAASDSAKEVAR